MSEFEASPTFDALHTRLLEVTTLLGGSGGGGGMRRATPLDDLWWMDMLTTVDTLILHNHPLPAAFDAALVREVHQNAYREGVAVLASPEFSKLSAGTFFRDFLDQHVQRKLSIYSAHDTTLIPMLGILRVYENHAHPPLAANLVMETYMDPANDSKRWVHFIYNGCPLVLPTGACQSHPGDRSFYSWDSFLDFVGPSLVRHDEIKNLCKARN